MRSRWLAYLCVCLSLIFGTAWADGNRIQVDIAPKDLPTALDELAAQADLQMLFDRASVRDKKTPGLKGTYSRREAVEKLLAGSGLVYTFTADNAVAIKKPERVALDDTTEAAPKKRGSDEHVALPEMTVTASPVNETSYNVPDATTATKTDTPIMETPLSIQVIPQQVLRDQQVVRIEKALQNVSGVYTRDGGSAQNNFLIRGFETGSYYVDGARIAAGSPATAPRETANIEQIEVLKGPASILYGRIEAGGLINIVRKQPLTSPYYALEQQFGSFDFYRTAVDATGPLTQDDALLYRFNLAYENAGSFREFLSGDRVFVAPALRWNITPPPRPISIWNTCTAMNRGTKDCPSFPGRTAPPPCRENATWASPAT